MKKSLVLASLFALPVMAGDSAPILSPAPAASPFSVELGATYRFATKEMRNYAPAKEIDVYGPEITGVYSLTPAHAVTLRFGYNYGSEVLRMGDGVASASETIRVNSFYLMPGYRYTADLNEKWSIFAGVSVGVTNESLKYRGFSYHPYAGDNVWKMHDADWAIVGTIELGVQYHMTDSAYLYAAYELYANGAEPRFPDAGSFGGKTQVYHSIRAGVGFDF